jgi:hypothetical protein
MNQLNLAAQAAAPISDNLGDAFENDMAIVLSSNK